MLVAYFLVSDISTEDDLQKAIRESEQEARENEKKKKEALERENQNNLFGNTSTNSNTSNQM